MDKEKNSISVDLSSLRSYGRVLDIGYKTSGIIYRALINADRMDEAAVALNSEKGLNMSDWISGYPDKLPFEESSFDMAVLFFSMGLIDKKRYRKKALAEISRVLDEKGKLYIWDINVKHICFGLRRSVEVILPGQESDILDITTPVRIGSYKAKKLLPEIENYFDVLSVDEYDEYFSIAAVKKSFVNV